MDVEPRAQLARVLRSVARSRPDCVLVTGDVAHDGKAGSYRAAARALAAFACPVHVIPGNHDRAGVLTAEFGAAPAVAAIGNWRLALLDSAVPGREDGRLADGTLPAVSRRLDALPPGPVAVVLHHPPVPVGSPWIDAMGLQASAAFLDWVDARGDVRLVLAGHVHQAACRRRGAAKVLTAPATCVQFAPRTNRFAIGDRRPAWRSLRLHADGHSETRIHRLSA